VTVAPEGRPAAGVAAMLEAPRFEVVPLTGVDAEVDHLPPGATVTVTCSPRRGVDTTIALAERLAHRGFDAVPHVAARMLRSRAHLEEVTGRLIGAGVRDVFVIGGDPSEPVGPYEAAGQVLETLEELGRPFPAVGIAGYPERHPLIDAEELDRALLDKQPLASYLVTQICFDPAATFRWLARIRDLGVGLPVHLGLPGAVTRRKLLEIALRIGVGDSIRYLTKHGSLVARLVRRGSYRPDAFLAGLSPSLGRGDGGIAGFHINTFNQVRSTERWRRRTIDAYRWAGSAGPENLPEGGEGA
jgi:methylenetetrahydrofolate reductase (NADPH)